MAPLLKHLYIIEFYEHSVCQISIFFYKSKIFFIKVSVCRKTKNIYYKKKIKIKVAWVEKRFKIQNQRLWDRIALESALFLN